MDKFYETERKWIPAEICGKWVCVYCDNEAEIKYIATGHDHTDYHYHVCDCEGATKNGKPWNELV